ncbi:MAG: TolC family protein [Lacibacter sp.]|jgi:outer membrane protein TolC
MKKKLTLLSASWLISVCLLGQQLSVEEAIQIAIEKNFNVVIEKQNKAAAALLNNWGQAGLWPVAGINATTSIASNNLTQKLVNGTVIERDGAILRNMNAGLAISWRIFDGMRMFATKRRLEELEQMGELNFRRQVNATVFDVISSYYQIVQLKQQRSALLETIRFFEERKQIAEDRYRIGTAPKTDLLQAQVDLNLQKANLMNIENSIQVAKTNFNNLLARKPDTPFEIKDIITPDADISFASILQKAETGNFDLLLAQSNLTVLLQTKREIIAQRLPTVTLNGNYNFSQSKNDAGFTLFSRNTGPNGNIGIAIPLFNGGNFVRQQKVADINIRNQQVQIDLIRNQVHTSLLNAYQNFRNALSLVQLEKENLELIRENNLIATERFKKLSITSLELRQVQLDFINSQTRYINALFLAKIAETEMKLLAGDLAGL